MVRGDHVMLIHMYRPSFESACLHRNIQYCSFFLAEKVQYCSLNNGINIFLASRKLKLKLLCPTIKYHWAWARIEYPDF